MTLATMLDALRARHLRERGWCCLDEVSDDHARRRTDLVALYTWGKPYAVGYEIKLTRADWLRELDDPSKRGWIEETCRFRWFAAPKGVVELSELPAGWGLILVSDAGKARRKLAAPAREVPAIPRWLTRQMWKQDVRIIRAQIRQAEAEGQVLEGRLQAREEKVREQEGELRQRHIALNQETARLEGVWRDLVKLAGVDVRWNQTKIRRTAEELYQGMEQRAAQRVREQAERALLEIERLVGAAKEAGVA